MKPTKELKDLGLSYGEAAHGVQSAVAHRINTGGNDAEPKHLRVGVDLRAIDHGALVDLLIAAGVIKLEDYLEFLRLYVNDEVASEQDRTGVTFR